MFTDQPITPSRFRWLLLAKYRNHLVVGITGHRDLLVADKATIKRAVHEKLLHLARNRRVLLVSALAYGADQWVVECAEELIRNGKANIDLCVPLSMERGEFVRYSFPQKDEADYFTGEKKQNQYQAEQAFFDRIIDNPATVVVRLYQKSQYSGQQQALSKRERDGQYEQVGKFMVRHADHLLALWDGVDGGGAGGTSDVVSMMVQGKSLLGGAISRKKTPQYLHQYVVPRRKNTFPIGRRFARSDTNWPTAPAYTWVDGPVNNKAAEHPRRLPALFRLLGWLIPFLFLADVNLDSQRPLTSVVWSDRGSWPDEVMVWAGLGGLYIGAWLLYRRFHRGRIVLLEFVYPLLIALLVLLFGTIGFSQAQLGTFSDNFFGAANLITLNTSVFSTIQTSGKGALEPNTLLKIARILGGFLAGYGFILAFALTAGKENIARLLFFIHRRFGRSFSVVLGRGTMAINLAIDLTRNNRHQVILLTDQIDTTLLDRLGEYRVWPFQGQITARPAIEKTFFWRAAGVYVIDESDENNFRCTQELDNIYTLRKKTPSLHRWLLSDGMHWLFGHLPDAARAWIHNDRKPTWYVHQQDGRQRALLQSITRQYVRTFSINENTTRRLLLRYPIDRFRQGGATLAEVVILGFGPWGQHLTLTCLQMGHYTPNKHLHLTVYYRPDETATVEAFQREHPELFQNPTREGLFSQGSNAQAIQQYTFFTRHRPADPRTTTANQVWPVIEFWPLPTAETDLVNPDFSLYALIRPDRVVSVYVCQPTGLESAALLGRILPRIEWHKQGQPGNDGGGLNPVDVQVFCYYNFPDPDEEQYVEMKLNAMAPYLPVVCFGNLINECVADAIRNESMNRIARQIALLYACLYGDAVINEIIGLRELLTDLKFDDEDAWAKKPDGTTRTYNETNIAKTQALLPRWAAMKQNRPQQFAAWLETCWQSLNEIDRESNVQAADHAWVKLRLLNLHWDKLTQHTPLLENQLEGLSEVEHRRWNAEKLLAGWLPQPDETLWKSYKPLLRDQKSHYFLMTFGQLPPKERDKDYTQVLGLPYFFERLTDWKAN